MRLKTTLMSLMFLLVIGDSAFAKDKWTLDYSYQTPSTEKLRGYGMVALKVSVYKLKDSGKTVQLAEFTCENGGKAAVVAGKFLGDLDLDYGVKNITINVGAKTVPIKTTLGGEAFMAAIVGSVARIASAKNSSLLVEFIKGRPEIADGAVAKGTYPTFLDRFDRYGWGTYGLGGFGNFHGWMNKCEPKNKRKDPTKDLDFLVKYKYRFEPWLDPAMFDDSDGIIKNTESDWMIKASEDRGLPVSFRVYGDTGSADWTARRFPEFCDKPADFLMSAWHGPRLDWKFKPHMSWNSDFYRYMTVKTMELMTPHAADPMVMSWMYPAGELVHSEWYEMHADYSRNSAESWRAYLKGSGFTLKELGLFNSGNESEYLDWSQVPVPEFATFAGLGGRIKSLAGEWYYRAENQKGEGLKSGWSEAAVGASGWDTIKMPGNDNFYDLFEQLGYHKKPHIKLDKAVWFKRTFNLTSATLKEYKNLYLYWFPMSHVRVHSGKNAVYHQVFINGEKAGGIGRWGALEIAKLLKPGVNTVSLRLVSPTWDGRIFISSREPSVYPYLGNVGNRLWLLWKAWLKDAKYKASCEIFDGMRQVDGDRPIKFMAPLKLGSERWLKICRKYGAWPHFTGEGVWYFPWYKRYGFLYGLPGTSETAGPANNLRDQINSFRRIFLAGLNGHDAVFLAQTYTRNPELRKFWVDHAPVLKRLGRFDLFGQQVLIFRSSRSSVLNTSINPYPKLGESTRLIQTSWDWDLGRGTLQTLGYSYLYLDEQGVADGKMAGYPVMIDCGNETMDLKSVENLRKWVASGGVFITLPFTGRNSELAADSWPINALTGCKIKAIRSASKGKVTIKPKQSLFSKLSGRTFDENGSCKDYVGNELNQTSVSFIPGDDTEVIATYENGDPAIVKHKIGNGYVVALGTAFWRNSQDVMGLWWPKKNETEFIRDLLAKTKLGEPLCESDDRLVWAQPYRSVNGVNFVTVLVDWHKKDEAKREVTVSMRVPRKPAQIVAYGVDGVKKLPFSWSGGIAKVKVEMPPREVKVLSAEVYEHSSAVSHWWNRQLRYWYALDKPNFDFSPYKKGKYADPTLALRPNARFTQNDPGADWNKPEFDDSKWSSAPMTVFNFFGAKPDKPIWVRKTFAIPESWKTRGGKVFLKMEKWTRNDIFLGDVDIFLNGALLRSVDFGKKIHHISLDLSKLLSEKKNVIALRFKKGRKYRGVLGDVYLYHWRYPRKSMNLRGEWTTVNAGDSVAGKAMIPGKGAAKRLRRSIIIPEEWRGSDVRLFLENTRGASVLGAYVNDKLIRYSRFGNVVDVDITNSLKFGASNIIKLDVNNKTFDIKEIRLDLR